MSGSSSGLVARRISVCTGHIIGNVHLEECLVEFLSGIRWTMMSFTSQSIVQIAISKTVVFDSRFEL